MGGSEVITTLLTKISVGKIRRFSTLSKKNNFSKGFLASKKGDYSQGFLLAKFAAKNTFLHP